MKKEIIFEFKSWIGRKFYNKKPNIKANSKNYLNVGCGYDHFNSWINANFFRALAPWKKKNRPDWMIDLRYPLNCDNNVFDGVFTEHTLEHLAPSDVFNLLKELNRVMKPGSPIRITVPDLDKYIDYYTGALVNKKFKRWDTGCEAIRSLTQNYQHISVWNYELLSKKLKDAGFINIKKNEFQQGVFKEVIKDKEARKWETLYIEAVK